MSVGLGKNGNDLLSQDANQAFLNQIEGFRKAGDLGSHNIEELAQNYANEGWGKVDESVVKYVKDVQQGNVELKKSITLSKGFVKSFSTGLKGIGSSIKNTLGNLVAGLGNALVSMGITAIATQIADWAFSAISYVWDEWITDNGAKKRAEESLQKFDEASATYKETSKSVDELTSKYEELSGKLNDTNITVEEQLQIKGELAELQDTLVEKYGTEASQLDLVNGKYKEQLELLNGISREKARDYLYGTEGVMNKNQDGKSAVELANDYINEKLKPGEYASENIAEGVNLGGVKIPDLGMFAGFNIDELLKKYPALTEYQAEGELRIKFDKDATRKDIYDQLTNLLSDVKKEVGENPTERQKNLIGSLERDIVNLNFDSVQYGKYQEDIKTAARAEMAFSSDNGVNNLEVDAKAAIEAYNKALSEYETKQTKETAEVYREAKEQLNLIKRRFNQYNPSEELQEGYMAIYQEIMGKRIKSIDEQLRDAFGEAENDGVKQGWRQRIQSLSNKEKIQLQVKIGDNAKVLTLQELDKLIKECQEEAKQSPIELTIDNTKAVDSMADMKTAVSSLGDLWEQTVKNQRKLGKDKKYISEDGQVTKEGDAGGLAIGSADPALINSVESAFSNYISTLNDNEAALAMNTALQQFEETMVRFPGDANAAQKAIDTLINSYIDQTKTLKNLDETNKQWSIDQLKAMGITNAEAVVTSRLNKANKQLLNGMSDLNDAFRSYGKAIQQGTSAGKDYRDGMNELKNTLHDMFTQVDEAGNETGFKFDFDDEFVLEHLDMLRQAAYGDVDALNELRREASKKIVADIEIHNVDPKDIEGIRNEINNLIDGVDLDQLEIGATFDDNAVIDGLNHMVQMGQIAQEDMNKILAGIGVVPVVTPKPVKITAQNLGALSDQIKKAYGSQAGEYAMRGMKDLGTVYVPEISYQVGSKISGAHYSKPSTQPSGSTGGSNGSNSGSDNKLQEDTKETFDWIEVKIQRLDEAIARLDKQVGNTYIKWGKRNKSLTDELGKVTEEIKVQEHAQKRYLQNAKAISNTAKNINNRVDTKPKKSDYGKGDKQYDYDLKQWNAANKIWKSGKYQELVQQGKIGKNDIERIQNKYLVNLINAYKEMYQKSVDAGDKVDDLKIKLGDLNKTKFDNVKSEYEGLISLIEDANNLVEERINNTQERGYFVNKKYYQQEIANVKEERKKKEIEYKKLIKIRDAAVASGAIEKDSEAWVQMTNDINAAELALMQYDTEIVKLNNDIRQLKWDAFDFMQGRLDRINSETETLIDLLDSLPLFDDNGEFTNRGRATESLYGIQYDVAAKKAEEYRKAIKELEKTMDPYDQKEIERLDAMRDGPWEQTKAMEAAKDATKDLIANGIQKHIEALNKLIDKYKQSLSDAKSLYDYQKNIANQTKNIASLERQLAAYAGDDSEESRANIQKLTEQLEEARTGLKETEWDKYISETNDMLDDMMTDYQEYMDKWLEDVDAVFEWAVSDVNSHVDEISKTLKTVAGDDGISLTSQLQSMLETSISNNTALITAYTKGNAELSSTAEQILDKIIANAKDVTSGTQGGSTSGNKNSSTSSNKTSSTNSNKKSTNTKTSPEELQRQAIEKEKQKKRSQIEAELAKLDKQENAAKQKAEKEIEKQEKAAKQKAATNKNTATYQAQQKNTTKSIMNNLNATLKEIQNKRKDYQQMLDDLNKYATGSRGIASNQLAWTQENGSELIFRKSDGAMLTPLNRGDMVFTKDMSQALWNIAKNPNILKQTVHIPNRTINNDNNLTVVLPNVMNYDQFKNAMMNDPKVKNFVQATTIGQALGKGKLNRGNL